MNVDSVVIHPNYDSESGDNDIALMKLSSAVAAAAGQPACLPMAGSVAPVGKSCFVLQQKFGMIL